MTPSLTQGRYPAPARSCGFLLSTKWYSVIYACNSISPIDSRPSSHRFLSKYETFVARLRTYRCIALTENKWKSNEWLEGHRVVRAHRVIFQRPATSRRHEIWQAKARRGEDSHDSRPGGFNNRPYETRPRQNLDQVRLGSPAHGLAGRGIGGWPRLDVDSNGVFD
jgi:hypothetical protein